MFAAYNLEKKYPMKKMRLLLICASILTVTGSFFSCENEKDASLYLRADSLNQVAYKVRYKDLKASCKAAHEAYRFSLNNSSLRAEALNNIGFCAFIHMDFETAEKFFQQVYETTTNELLLRIKEKYKKMSKGQRRLADYVCNDYDKAVFLTAAKLGEIVGVSESTVVRFATQLGYKGYPGFQKALEELVRNKLNSIQRMEVTYGRISQSEILETVLQSDIDKIKMTLADIDHKAFDLAIDTLLNARRVYVIGIRSCAPLASFLGFYLNLVCDNVSVVDVNSSSEIFEQLIRINEHDVIIGISFPRYSMRTLKALEFASNRKATVITLTDSVHSPMTLYSSCNLIARSDMASIVDSLVAPLSVINALIVAICNEKAEGSCFDVRDVGENLG